LAKGGSANDKGPASQGLCLCGRLDSNQHGIAPASTSSYATLKTMKVNIALVDQRLSPVSRGFR
jgi:hypothetical protein